jgi:hypothetical protein
MNHDLYNFSRTKLHGKSMGEFGPTDTTRKKGRQGWKVKVETNQVKIKQRKRKSLSKLWNFLKTIRATK